MTKDGTKQKMQGGDMARFHFAILTFHWVQGSPLPKGSVKPTVGFILELSDFPFAAGALTRGGGGRTIVPNGTNYC
jgi:hypothetical protein